MKHYNITKAIICGDPDLLEDYKQAAPNRIVPSLWEQIGPKEDELRTCIDSLDTWHLQESRLQLIGEVLTQYSGIASDDEILDPMWPFAPENNIPVGIPNLHFSSSPKASGSARKGKSHCQERR